VKFSAQKGQFHYKNFGSHTRVPPVCDPAAFEIGVTGSMTGAGKVNGEELKPTTCITQLPLFKAAVAS
jgi:hypothetical protein